MTRQGQTEERKHSASHTPPTTNPTPLPPRSAAGTTIATLNFGQLIGGLYAFGLFLGTIYRWGWWCGCGWALVGDLQGWGGCAWLAGWLGVWMAEWAPG